MVASISSLALLASKTTGLSKPIPSPFATATCFSNGINCSFQFNITV